jgi:hypothetical protein
MGELFNEWHKKKTFLNITTTSTGYTLAKFGIRQYVKYIDYVNNKNQRNPLFITLKSLVCCWTEIQQIWPCKWSSVLVVDCEGFCGHVDKDVEEGIIRLLKTPEKIIFVLSQSNHLNLSANIQETLKNHYDRIEEKFTSEHLDGESQKERN